MRKFIYAIAAALSVLSADAVEYATIKDGTSKAIDPGTLVEVTMIPGGSGSRVCQWTYASGGAGNYVLGTLDIQKFTLTGVSQISAGNCTLTVKLTPSSEINAVAPGTVIVLPESASGNYDVIIDQSTDLVTWQPFFSQTVNSTAEEKFFRTRIVKTPTPAPVPKK